MCLELLGVRPLTLLETFGQSKVTLLRGEVKYPFAIKGVRFGSKNNKSTHKKIRGVLLSSASANQTCHTSAMKLSPLVYGICTMVPGLIRQSAGGGNSQSARYCYSVWLRHLSIAHAHGFALPKTVAELGPGNSLGVCIAALLSGVERCFAFEVVDHTDAAINLTVFDELVALFHAREPIPGEDELPEVKPYLDSYHFPADVLTDEVLERALHPERLARIKTTLTDLSAPEALIEYQVPWHDQASMPAECVDMIYSQAVLEHVDDLEQTYAAMFRWLKPDGFMSHQVDFRSHGTAEEWNGHWAYSDLKWRLIRGNRNHLINRVPHSEHLNQLALNNFRLLEERVVRKCSSYRTSELARRFRTMSQDDLTTSGAFMLAKREPT